MLSLRRSCTSTHTASSLLRSLQCSDLKRYWVHRRILYVSNGREMLRQLCRKTLCISPLPTAMLLERASFVKWSMDIRVKQMTMKADAKKRLVLLDAHAILHRAYHALPDFTAPNGEPTGALYGLVAMLLKIVEELQPDYLVACFDLDN